MKKLKDIYYNIAAILIFLLIISGLFVVYFLVRNTQESAYELEYRHFEDRLETVDTDAAHRFGLIRTGISHVLKASFREGEETYLSKGDVSGLYEAYMTSSLANSIYIKQFHAICGGERILSIPEDTDPPDTLLKKNEEAFSLVTDSDGAGVLFYSKNAEIPGLTYLFMIGPEPVLSSLGDQTLTDIESVFLYDGQTGVLVRERDGQLRTLTDPVSENDTEIYSYICSLEENGESDIWYCRYLDDDLIMHHLILGMKPSGKSLTKRFAVGVITDDTIFLEANIRIMRRVIGIMLIVLLGLSGFFLLLLLISRRNRAQRAQILMLDEKNKASEERIRNLELLEQRERLETIGVLTSSIAHEFNNLLTPIMGYSVMSLNEAPVENEGLAENLAEIYNASSRAKQLISRMASYARLRDSVSFLYQSPDDILNEVLVMMKPAKPQHVEIRKELSCGEQCIWGDRIQLVQLFMNLILNAFQAMKEAGGTVTLGSVKEDGLVKVYVSDTGTGIRPEDLERIFDPFYTTKGEGGTGLGLSIAKRIAETHGASLNVSSTPGEGTVFTVIFPEKKAD